MATASFFVTGWKKGRGKKMKEKTRDGGGRKMESGKGREGKGREVMRR